MEKCIKCRSSAWTKNGSVGGVPKWKCKHCGYQSMRKAPRGRPASDKAWAVLLYVSGLSMNAIAKLLGMSATGVMKWLRMHAASLPDVMPQPESAGEPVVMELDEMWHYLKKSRKNSGSGRPIRVIPVTWLDGTSALVIIAASESSGKN